MNSEENWANGGTTELTRNVNERVHAEERANEQTDSRTTTLTIK